MSKFKSLILGHFLMGWLHVLSQGMSRSTYTLNMDISFGNGNSILKLLRGFSHSQIEFGVEWTIHFRQEAY